jgi:hypothetical protein
MSRSLLFLDIKLPCGKVYNNKFNGMELHFKVCKICDGSVHLITTDNLAGKNANKKTNKKMEITHSKREAILLKT